MVKQAFKKKYDYTSPEKYRLFLKKMFTTLTPRYYSVVSAQDVETSDGPMVAIQIVTDEIENPNYEPIAEVWINDEYIYLWQDHCWTIAVDKNNRCICNPPASASMLSPQKFSIAPAPCHKVMLIHRIGHEPVE